MSNTANRITRLREIDPHCHWCGVETELYPERLHKVLKKGELYPDNMATVDHIYRRWEKQARQEAMHKAIKTGSGIGIYYVLACIKCNFARSVKPKDTVSEVPVESSTAVLPKSEDTVENTK